MKDFNICSLYSSTWFPGRWYVNRNTGLFLLAAIDYKIGVTFSLEEQECVEVLNF